MQVTYGGEHSILIGDLQKEEELDEYGREILRYNEHTFRDSWSYYGLIPKSVPVIAPPDIQENTIEVPGSNGIVDLSDILVGHPLYYNRSGSLDFYVDHTHPTYTTWEERYDQILNDIHGTNRKVILTDAKGYYYEGRVKVNSWKSDKLASSITLDYNFAPYKKMLFTTYEDWLWDPFDFVNGTIPDKQGWYVRKVKNDTPSSESWTDLGTMKAGTMPVVPDILLDMDNPPANGYDSLPDNQRPYILLCIGNANEVQEKIFTGVGYKSYIKDSERVSSESNHYLKRDPLITIGAPGDNTFGPHWGIMLVNPASDYITMTIDFRQGRL